MSEETLVFTIDMNREQFNTLKRHFEITADAGEVRKNGARFNYEFRERACVEDDGTAMADPVDWTFVRFTITKAPIFHSMEDVKSGIMTEYRKAMDEIEES